ncbi:MAG TPA: SDR family NAD(P)-dependent oxidoreductase [Polyangiaceae bacterium]|nr:SDR family NAD(P)-dependent oxidoreductase [Polyangiaceae bacterium]
MKSTARVVVISGAASGIGRATALAFARRSDELELVDVNESGLARVREESLAAGARRVATTHVDVAKEESVSAFAQAFAQRNARCDVLVNNAGVLVAGGFLETEVEDWNFVFDVNLLGAVLLTRALLPGMLGARQGHVINVASASAFWNPSALTAYGCSKYALVGLSEALRQEVSPQGVRVTAICPSLIATPIVDHMRLRGSLDENESRRRMRDYLERHAPKPDLVAQAIVKASMRDVAVVPVGGAAWMLYYLKRLAPGALSRLFGVATKRLLGPDRAE